MIQPICSTKMQDIVKLESYGQFQTRLPGKRAVAMDLAAYLVCHSFSYLFKLLPLVK